VHLLEGEEPDLALLEERDFIRRRTGSSMAGEREFAIKHQLTREVAYASIPKARRGRLHASLAEWLAGGDWARDEHASLLAYHYAEAVRPEDADLAWADDPDELARLRREGVAWLRRAGELARGRYEIDEAIQLLTGATELVDDPIQQSELWREIGLCNALKFDGEAFWTAMQRSLEVCPDRATCADTYSLLAFHTASRSGMWRVRPERELIDEWIDRTLELSELNTAARARGLIARCRRGGRADVEIAAEASAIAERLGEPELRSYAWEARAQAAFDARLYDEAMTWIERRLELIDQITDPDHLSDLYGEAIPYCAAVGRFREAHRLAERGDDITSRLTPHHRVHGVSFLLEHEELLGSWQRIAALTERAERSVEANLDTPCIRNMRSLLLCAAASVELGRDNEGRLLEAKAEQLEMAGHDKILSAPRTRLALAW
jgi:tetratricopeptide (TPR) repeat protein